MKISWASLKASMGYKQLKMMKVIFNKNKNIDNVMNVIML